MTDSAGKSREMRHDSYLSCPLSSTMSFSKATML